jgi:hypothetical protein
MLPCMRYTCHCLIPFGLHHDHANEGDVIASHNRALRNPQKGPRLHARRNDQISLQCNQDSKLRIQIKSHDRERRDL